MPEEPRQPRPAGTIGAGTEAELPALDVRLGAARAFTQAGALHVSTGGATRVWRWTGTGFATVGLSRRGGPELVDRERFGDVCDWELPGGTAPGRARLLGLSARPDTDESFTSEHIRVAADIDYPEAQLTVRFLIWAYPDVCGVRTQLLVKALPGYEPPPAAPEPTGVDRSQWRVIRATEGKGSPDALFDDSGKTVWAVPHGANADAVSEAIVDLGREIAAVGFGVRQQDDYRRQWAPERVLVAYSLDGRTWSDEICADISRATYLQAMPHPACPARYVRMRLPATALPYTGAYGTALSEVFVFDASSPVPELPDGRVEHLPVAVAGRGVGLVDFFSETQFRNAPGKDISVVRRQAGSTGSDADASMLWAETDGEGVCVVKESHKTANHRGHLTGEFRWGSDGIECTGWGLSPREITSDWCRAWGTWTILYHGGEARRQESVKLFDATRFPVHPERDGLFLACTWGGGTTSQESRRLAWEDPVLEDLEAVAELGIDVYQIDDGYQVKNLDSSAPDGGRGWKPHPEIYPQDWQHVRTAAEALGVRLGLWAPVQSISAADLAWNQERGDFVVWKMDFANLHNYGRRNAVETKVRNFIARFDHEVDVAWDLTEIYPRYGYLWGREYGSIWLENRKKRMRPWILYTPSLTLRDAWQLSAYVNIRKFQLPVVNVAQVDPPSDAREHPQAYAVAIAAVGIPMFFEQPSCFEGAQKQQVIETLRLFRSCREEMLRQLVYPIGSVPDNASVTGFQSCRAGESNGYIILFRELHAPGPECTVHLRFLADCELRIDDLRRGVGRTVAVGSDGSFSWDIERPADFALVRYSR